MSLRSRSRLAESLPDASGQIDEQFAFWRFAPRLWSPRAPWTPRLPLGHGEPHDGVAEIGRPNQREWTPRDRVMPRTMACTLRLRAVPCRRVESLRTAIQENEKTVSPQDGTRCKTAAKAASLKTGYGRLGVPASDATPGLSEARRLLPILESDDVEKRLSAPTRHVPQAETRSRKCHDPVPTRAGQGRFVPRFPTRKMGATHSWKANAEYFAATPRDRDGAVVPRKAACDLSCRPPDARHISPRHLEPLVRVSLWHVARSRREPLRRERMQTRFLDQYESQVPIYKDFEVSDDLLPPSRCVFVGRPEANSALACWPKKSASLRRRGFKINGDVHASEREALCMRDNPSMPRIWCSRPGNDALRTVKASRLEAPAE